MEDKIDPTMYDKDILILDILKEIFTIQSTGLKKIDSMKGFEGYTNAYDEVISLLKSKVSK